MASNSRQKTTMAKLNRERTLRERRELKESKKAARREAAAVARVQGSGAIAPDAQPLEMGHLSP
jgi:hypothetical protein